jgi:hypothetical protein
MIGGRNGQGNFVESEDESSPEEDVVNTIIIVIIISGTTTRIGPWPPLTDFRDG